MNNSRKLPSYPLFVKDPYFSVWSATEILNSANPTFWYGQERKIYGFIKIDGVPYEFLGNSGLTQKIEQKSIDVTSFTTDYTFVKDDVTLKVSFVSPLPLDDMDTLSCPVCYMNYEVISDNKHEYEVSIAVNENICYNEDKRLSANRGIVGATFKLDNFETTWFGLVRQAPLSHAEDNITSDWGYYYIAGENSRLINAFGLTDYLLSKEDLRYNRSNILNDGYQCRTQYILAYNTSSKGKIMFAYDDVIAIRYFGDYLKDYYFDNGKTIIDALQETYVNSEKIDKHLAELDADLKKKALKHGEEYLNVLYASLRQSITAHKLVKDKNGKVLFLSRENNSNSCIGTVDVSYPSIPLFLLYDTEYVKGMMRPIFKFAKMPVWTYDFAPHDVGTYPNCDGQVYGLKNPSDDRYLATYNGWYGGQVRTRPMVYLYPANSDVFEYKYQMPIEECADMIIMCEACRARDNDNDFLKENYDLLTKWVIYLEKLGLVPANQLCTDDFAGHLDKNLNLAIKATVGIACFANISKALGYNDIYNQYRAISEDFAQKITEFAYKFKWSPLTWETDDSTFSLKYNLAFDKILKLNLFSKDFYEREIDCYISKLNPYGVPLDSRKDYTKSDWTLWSASLTDNVEKQKSIISGVNNLLVKGFVRLPFGDFYSTVTGVYEKFIARSVQGGNFILLLND